MAAEEHGTVEQQVKDKSFDIEVPVLTRHLHREPERRESLEIYAVQVVKATSAEVTRDGQGIQPTAAGSL